MNKFRCRECDIHGPGSADAKTGPIVRAMNDFLCLCFF